METPLDSARIARAFAAQRSYGEPSRDMRVIGVTGTNGKTTTTHLIASVATHAGFKARALGTINSALTTLGEPELAQALSDMRDEGVEVVAMEVSSHGLAQHRVDAVSFEVTAFSNLSQDHLDYHHDMHAYLAAKKRLFFDLESQVSVINTDNDTGRMLVAALAENRPKRSVITVGGARAHIEAKKVNETVAATTFDLLIDDRTLAVSLPLVGAHNVDNALLAAGCCHALGIDATTIAAALSAAPQVPGRLQAVGNTRGIGIFIDYAHTPDALEHALGSLRRITTGRLFVVFGCGGDRDTTKRPLMGAVAVRLADEVIVTTDNPRNEAPASIIEQIVAGIDAASVDDVTVIVDRQGAIERAIDQARAGDTVLIAGKGHETYQIFADETIDFDDAQVAATACAGTQVPGE